MKLAILPLTLHLMPGGKLPLRIFESRYIRMVSEAAGTGNGFGIGMLDDEQGKRTHSLFMLGTRVQIVDFYSLADGLLGITVEGTERFLIRSLSQDADGLLQAEVSLLDNWQSCSLSSFERVLSDKLQEVFDEYPELAELHPSPRWTDAAWVTQRWLEVLPLGGHQTQLLMAEDNCRRALAFLMTMIKPDSVPGLRH
ncbi:LON peptidase substrate-binding domain-containing protein [Zobellella maritima]|uniref:LON peptidase substrate-binding domain-containing protein n=1 Tax=Zobellella maritima TaxID=2059725 RepID=UPI000E2FF82C|nr:LON peptidase substrate-binding domain-containing protein [Zobellella maritima]